MILFRKDVAYFEGIKAGLGRALEYKWNIAIFSLIASSFVLFPDFTVSWPVKWSVNETGSVVFFVLGWMSTIYTHLPAL